MSVLLFMLLLFLGLPIIFGIVLIMRSRGKSLGYPACGQCLYNLTGTIGTTSRCPECGVEFSLAGILPATARRSRSMMWGGIVLLLTPLLMGVIFVGVPAMIFSQRSAAAARAAVAARNSAMASATPAVTSPQPAQPVAVPVPEPLTPQRVASMSVQEAAAASEQITMSINAGGLEPAVIDRLHEDQKRLQERLAQLQGRPGLE